MKQKITTLKVRKRNQFGATNLFGMQLLHQIIHATLKVPVPFGNLKLILLKVKISVQFGK